MASPSPSRSDVFPIAEEPSKYSMLPHKNITYFSNDHCGAIRSRSARYSLEMTRCLDDKPGHLAIMVLGPDEGHCWMLGDVKRPALLKRPLKKHMKKRSDE